MANLLSLGNKNKSIYFVLRSTFRNFAAKFELKDCILRYGKSYFNR